MLNDDQRVAQIAQALQSRDQAVVITLVQADRWLIQDVQHARQARTNLGSQTDALRLTTGQRRGPTVEREIGQADVDKKLQARLDFFQYRPGNDLVAVVKLQGVQEYRGFFDRQRGQARDRLLPMRS